MRIIISGGGTGGHIYPAVAIADALKANDSSVEILFVGALGKMEMEKVPKAGYRIIGLPIVGIQRSVSLGNFLFPYKLIKSLLIARSVIKEFKPNVAVGVGGYASGPLLIMASLLGIPTLIQEQNSYAGITNKVLAKWASRICVAYPGMEVFFDSQKIKLLGNPVRKDILAITAKRAMAISHFQLDPHKKTLFVMGGSLGAKSINEGMLAGIGQLAQKGYQVLWQTGKGYFEKAQTAVKNSKLTDIKVFDFIYEMDLAYAAADVVISRAGALSVSELCLTAKPAILVPYPFASEDHQTKNALSLAESNAAIMIKDNEVNERLIPEVMNLLENTEKQKVLSANIKMLARPHAAEDIASEVVQLVN